MVTLVKSVQTCFACPSQWDAWDTEGNSYYLRYRWGCGQVMQQSMMVNGVEQWMVRGIEVASFEVGDDMDGMITLAEFAMRAGLVIEGHSHT